jgi:hypothetical protein
MEKILKSFLMMLSVSILFMLPVTAGVYDYRTDIKTDTDYEATGVGVVTANVVLLKEVYDDDVSTISITSDTVTDTPTVVNYHTATRLLDINGLTANTTRTLSISYDIDALTASAAIGVFMDNISWIWLVCIIGFAPAALAAMFTGKV